MAVIFIEKKVALISTARHSMPCLRVLMTLHMKGKSQHETFTLKSSLKLRYRSSAIL